MFMIHVLVTRVSWKVTVIVGVHVWAVIIMSKDIFLLGPPSQFVFCSSSPGFEPLIAICSSLDYLCSRPRPKAQYMIWALIPTIIYNIELKNIGVYRFFFLVIWSWNNNLQTTIFTNFAKHLIVILKLLLQNRNGRGFRFKIST